MKAVFGVVVIVGWAAAGGGDASASAGNGLGEWVIGGEGSAESGRFLCLHCQTSEDCGLQASKGRVQKDMEWKLWKTDGLYKEQEVNDVRLCLRSWMVGCNGPRGPHLCNSYTEVCMTSEALFDEVHRTAHHELCSSVAFMGPSSVTLIITIPLVLCTVSLVLVIVTLHHSFSHGYCQCPPSLDKVPVMLCATVLIVFSVLTFFSPHFMVGIVGMITGHLAIISHTAVASAQEHPLLSLSLGPADTKDSTERVQKWMFFSAVATLMLVYSVWGAGYPNRAGLSYNELGKQCADFYHFFAIDQRLMGPGHNKEVKYWGYCEREYVADTLWNVTAVIWIGLVLSGIHLYTLGTVAFTTTLQQHDPEEHIEAAGGPGTFLVTKRDMGSGRYREKVPGRLQSVASYSDIRMSEPL